MSLQSLASPSRLESCQRLGCLSSHTVGSSPVRRVRGKRLPIGAQMRILRRWQGRRSALRCYMRNCYRDCGRHRSVTPGARYSRASRRHLRSGRRVQRQVAPLGQIRYWLRRIPYRRGSAWRRTPGPNRSSSSFMLLRHVATNSRCPRVANACKSTRHALGTLDGSGRYSRQYPRGGTR
jgi:hypothetical protein